MQKRIISRVPAITVSFFAAAFALDPGGLFAASDCLEQPNRIAAQGGHWYYHLDRASGRKCWHLAEPEPAARQAEVPPAQPAPDAAPQPPFSSFFSSLTGGFTTAGTAQPDTANRDARGMAIAHPEPSKGDDASPPKRRQRADAKPGSVPKPDRQASSRPANEPADQSRSGSLNQAERDALFREYLRWRERQ